MLNLICSGSFLEGHDQFYLTHRSVSVFRGLASQLSMHEEANQCDVQSENFVYRFDTVSGLKDKKSLFKTVYDGVQRASRYVFAHLVGVLEVSPNQQ